MDIKEKLVGLLNNSFAKQHEKRGLLTAQHTATDLIAHGVTAQGATDNNVGCKWISVKDGLPEVGQQVLVFCRSRMSMNHVTVSTYKTDYSYTRRCYWSRRVKDVTHWMPLPSPPKEGAEHDT